MFKLVLNQFYASNLSRSTLFGLELPCPAIKVTIKDTVLRTRRKIHADSEATWNEIFILDIDEVDYRDKTLQVTVEIINRGIFGNVHESMGSGTVTLIDVLPDVDTLTHFMIQIYDEKGLSAGRLMCNGSLTTSHDDNLVNYYGKKTASMKLPQSLQCSKPKSISSGDVHNLFQLKDGLHINLGELMHEVEVILIQDPKHSITRVPGKLYIFERYVCFYGKLFKMKKLLRIPFYICSAIWTNDYNTRISIESDQGVVIFKNYFDISQHISILQKQWNTFCNNQASEVKSPNSRSFSGKLEESDSDSEDDESFRKKIPLADSILITRENLNAYIDDEYGQSSRKLVLSDRIFKVTLKDFFKLFLADDSLYGKTVFMESSNCSNLVTSEWKDDVNFAGTQCREIAFLKQVGLPGLKEAKSISLEQLRFYGDPTMGYILDTSTRVHDIPAGDSFSVDDSMTIREASDGKSVSINFYLEVKWIKTSYLKGFINGPAERETSKSIIEYAEFLETRINAWGQKNNGSSASSPSSRPISPLSSSTSSKKIVWNPSADDEEENGENTLNSNLWNAVPSSAFISVGSVKSDKDKDKDKDSSKGGGGEGGEASPSRRKYGILVRKQGSRQVSFDEKSISDDTRRGGGGEAGGDDKMPTATLLPCFSTLEILLILFLLLSCCLHLNEWLQAKEMDKTLQQQCALLSRDQKPPQGSEKMNGLGIIRNILGI